MKKTFYLIIIFWISAVGILFFWHYNSMKRSNREIAYQICKGYFELVLLAREWNALHGGVYVFVDNTTNPNPYLKDPLRDIKVSKKLMLTKMNPAYMTRQLSELSKKEKRIQINITSLHPVNPKNLPNNLEKIALLSFYNGKKEFFKKIGKKYFYMGVLVAYKPCLKCHTDKKLKVGSILGGISILLPFSPNLPIFSLALGHLLICLIGLIFIIYLGINLTKAYDKIKKQAIIDGLTGIYNRRALEKKLSEEFFRAKRENVPLSLIMCDIDWFKKYNDTYGHRQGDVCLKEVAKAISKSLKRATDFCARYGGEEFVIVLPNTDEKGALLVAEDICKNVRALNIEHKESLYHFVTISLGVVTVRNFSDKSYEDLIKEADKRLYKAKEKGRNQINFISF